MFSSSFATLNNDDISKNIMFGTNEWGDERIRKEDNERKKREKEKEEKLRNEFKKKYENKEKNCIQIEKRRLKEYKELHGDYWVHPEITNCYIPLTIKGVSSLDKVNRISLWLQDNGNFITSITELARIGGNDWTIDEYLELHCEKKNEDGQVKYYYKGNL